MGQVGVGAVTTDTYSSSTVSYLPGRLGGCLLQLAGGDLLQWLTTKARGSRGAATHSAIICIQHMNWYTELLTQAHRQYCDKHKQRLFLYTSKMSALHQWLPNAYLLYLASAVCSAADINFCRSCCFFSLSFLRSSIFFNSAISISSSSTCSSYMCI